jgi:hypothetical protein
MNEQEYQRAVRMIKSQWSSHFTPKQVSLSGTLLLTVQDKHNGEEQTFDDFEAFDRWWSQQLHGMMIKQRVRDHLEDRGHELK